MKIRLYSDIHLEFRNFYIPKLDTDAETVLVLAGDISSGVLDVGWFREVSSRFAKVLYVFGNHEFYGSSLSSSDVFRASLAEFSNIHVLENEEITIDGVNFFGGTMWTGTTDRKLETTLNDFRYIDNEAKTDKITVLDLAAQHQKFLHDLNQWLGKTGAGTKVVITHHLPSILSVPTMYLGSKLTPLFAANLDEFIESSDVDYWFHGHTHSRAEYVLGNTKVKCFPVGYPHERTRVVPDNLFEV